MTARIATRLLVAGVLLSTGSTVRAQSGYATIYSFSQRSSYRNPDGAHPFHGLLRASDGNFYGTCTVGGGYTAGTLFRISPAGLFTVMHTFYVGTSLPYGWLIQAKDGNMYGTTDRADSVYRMTLTGKFMVLHILQGADGSGVGAGLTEARNGDLYGTADGGGLYNWGTVFRITESGNFTVLYTFTGGADGGNPQGGLVRARDGNLYGLCSSGGANGTGTLYRISPEGGFTLMHTFGAWDGHTEGMNIDGAYPWSTLIEGAGGRLYGTARYGGVHGGGTVFAMNLNGTFTTLHNFHSNWRDYDGLYPVNGLMQARDGKFYGTTVYGGQHGQWGGVIYRINSNGDFTTVYNFRQTGGGAVDASTLTEGTDGYLYGTTVWGGVNHEGSIFRIPLPP